MKKLLKKMLIIVALLFATLSINAQTYYKSTDLLNINYGNGYTGWVNCVISTKIDIDNSQIVIYSSQTQVFNVYNSQEYNYSNYKLIRCWCTDYDKVNCIMDLYFYQSSNWYIKLSYNNIEYKYRLKY